MPDKNLEIQHVQTFLKSLGGFSQTASYQKEPELDFCIEIPDGIIGIEVTQLFHPKRSKRNCSKTT